MDYRMTRLGIRCLAARYALVSYSLLVIFIVWVILIIIAVILLMVYSEDVGMGSGYWWVILVGGILGLIFGIVLLMCCAQGANRLSWRKRMLMYSALDDIENEKLKDTEYGIRSGKEGAWIEVGHKSSIGKLE